MNGLLLLPFMHTYVQTNKNWLSQILKQIENYK